MAVLSWPRCSSARQLRSTAEHFSEDAALLGLVGSDADNLRDAIAGEAYEVDVMYKRFTDDAAAVGDVAAAARFAEIRRDEQGHLAAFQESLRRLEAEAVALSAARTAPARRPTGV